MQSHLTQWHRRAHLSASMHTRRLAEATPSLSFDISHSARRATESAKRLSLERLLSGGLMINIFFFVADLHGSRLSAVFRRNQRYIPWSLVAQAVCTLNHR